MLRYDSAAKTHKGKVRDVNEDAYVATGNVFAVADGMGGHQAGEVASALALSAALEYIEGNEGTRPPESLVEKAFVLANSRVHEKASSDARYRNMGTTLTLALVINDTAYLGHVGDSRAYILREGRLQRVTTDHSLVAKMVEDGEITEDAARTHPQRNIILRALGPDPEVEVDIHSLELQPGDVILICSDGVFGALTERDMRDVLQETPTTGEAVERLVDLSLDAGGLDNITAVVISASEEVAPLPTPGAPLPPEPAPEFAAGTEPARPVPAGSKAEGGRRAWWKRKAVIVPLVVLIILGATFGIGYALFNNSYYVGADRGEVVVYQGFPFYIFGRRAARVVLRSGVEMEYLPDTWSDKVEENLETEGYQGSVETIERLEEIAARNTSSVPDLRDMTLESARKELEEAGLVLGEVRDSLAMEKPSGVVVRQRPERGARLVKESEVDVWISIGGIR